ncbi:MAG TPA: type IV toxin-antitoxin system AbiEi family antitoxin domain-containing protein [Thermoleophilaceae bacterium]|nr:type IV toxin-antitoxin system AbiEi family antitoxin domain-containing protein [Thermoleophilaceae bacterium]
MDVLGRTVEAELGRIAAAAHGVVTRAQLLEAGVSRTEIASRLRSGALLREHRGVYRVGHRAPSIEATYFAAVVAAGKRAVLSGRAAAYVWGLVKGDAPPAEVISPNQRRIDGVTVHRCRNLSALDVGTCRRVPVTTVARTLVDLAAVLSPEALARACHEAGVRYRTGPADVERVLGRRPTSLGARKLRQIISGDTRVTLSRLESRFLALMRDARLPLPVTNRPAGGRRVDCRWPEYGLTVELDSYRFHNTRHAWEQDRRREREARARGDDFRRYTYGDVLENPAPMLAELRAALTKRPE